MPRFKELIQNFKKLIKSELPDPGKIHAHYDYEDGFDDGLNRAAEILEDLERHEFIRNFKS